MNFKRLILKSKWRIWKTKLLPKG